MPGGGTAIVCGPRSGRIKRCVHCGGVSSKLCDGPRADNSKRTCDRPLCTRCATHVEPNLDFCRAHRGAAETAAAQAVLPLGGV